MEETLTDCLVRVREDLRNLKKVRDYIDANTETEERCSVTWRTIEAFNSILSVCSSQNTPETNALDTLLDSFYYLARNNSDDSVWEDFGFELGIICVKVLSAIERSEIFEILFCKLLSVIGIICEHNSNVWKAAARQILNVLINKKVSLSYLEAILKLYISILKNIDSLALHDFSSQNLLLLKALSLLVQKVGDFEIQSTVIQLIFLHLSNEKKLMSDFFSTVEQQLFESLKFTDFEDDCRLYLNAVNKPRRGFERKIYSICCHVLYLGGCFVEPPIEKNSIWVDANKDTERLSIKYGDLELSENNVILIQFSEIINFEVENDKSEGNRCLTIQTKNLMSIHKDARNNDICLVAEDMGEMFEFVRFLEGIGEKKKKSGGRESKTADRLFIDRNSPRMEVQDNAITSSEKPAVDHILPDVLSLFEKPSEVTIKSSQTTRIPDITPPRARKVVLESQELSPNSFVESLNKHIGSSEHRHTFEDSVETVEFLQKATPANHKLFRSPHQIFEITEEKDNNLNFLFGENKENITFVSPKPNVRTYGRKSPAVPPTKTPEKPPIPATKTPEKPAIPPTKSLEIPVIPPTGRVLRDRKNSEVKLSNTQSDDFFQAGPSALEKKKPCLPKLKRSTKATKISKNQKKENEKKDKTEPPNNLEIFVSKEAHCENKTKTKQLGRQNSNENSTDTPKKSEIQQERETPKEKQFERQNEFILEVKVRKRRELREKPKESIVEKSPNKKQTQRQQAELPKQTKNPRTEQKHHTKPSLLDPNGYAYQRWCKPTTSERSNFWLRKLNTKQKPKTDSGAIFDFSDESDSTLGNCKSKKRVSHSRRTLKTRPKQTSLRQVKEILKKSPLTKEKPKKNPPQNNKPDVPSEPASPLKEASVKSPESITESLLEPPQLEFVSERSLLVPSLNEPPPPDDSEYESVSDEEPPPENESKKPDHSGTNISVLKGCIQKTPKPELPKKVSSSFRHRLLKVEEKDKQQTDEIIQTIDKATKHLFNYLQRKDGERVVSYLNAAETASEAFDSETDDLSLRAKRIQRAILYYKAGCSMSDFCDSLSNQFSKVREALKEFKEKKDTSQTIDQINTRLSRLIKSEINRSIESEWETKRNKLLRCATILRSDFTEFV